ncbi:hypothetical protein ACYSNP_10685, partial [Myroides sp. LJL110]
TPGEPGGPGKGVNMVVNQDGLWIYNEATGTWTNVHGKDGKDGKSAFDLWKEVPGNENKTQEEFVAGLVGAQGIAGLPGQSGTPGTPGEPGGPGKGVNMVVNQDGLWIYNEATGSWINVHGKDGEKGEDGKSAFELWKEIAGNETKTLEEFLAGLVGAQGITGSPGQSGTPGTPGEPGGPGKGVNMVVNQDGLWIYNEATGTWTNVHGKDGKDGKSAFDLWKEVPGNENKTQEEFVAGLIGAQGIAGLPGQSGTPGTPGEPGGPGKGVNMVVNQDGLWIYNESTGSWINVHGKDGVDGKSAFEIWKQQPGNANKDEAAFLTSIKGATGNTGAKGDKGDKGDSGYDFEDQRDKSGVPGKPGASDGPAAGVTIVENKDGVWVYNPYRQEWKSLQAAQKVTTITNNKNGTYTYTAEDNGQTLINAVMPKFFYMPPVVFDTREKGNYTKNLYELYTDQFKNTLVRSEGASANIPVVDVADLEFHITYYDQNVFGNLKIDKQGNLTYTVLNNASKSSFINIVFVVKDK